jgi:hypothetical protein
VLSGHEIVDLLGKTSAAKPMFLSKLGSKCDLLEIAPKSLLGAVGVGVLKEK